MRNKNLSYKEYGFIYTEQCAFCVKEGTQFCSLQYSDGKCVNFKDMETLKSERK